MSWFTAGEIVIWLLLAALLGAVLGWLLRGLLRPPASPVVPNEDGAVAAGAETTEEPLPTLVREVDTGAAGTAPAEVPVSRSAPGEPRDPVADIAVRTAGGLTPPHDDLIRIHGVGPKIARMLESRGITSYRQVARLTAEEVAILNEALGVFPGRIERDDWIGSARELHREVYGSDPAR